MKHFLESIQRRIDLYKEYVKLEELIIGKTSREAYSNYDYKVNRVLEEVFLDWRHRGNYTSLDEVRDQLKFGFDFDGSGYLCLDRMTIDMEDYFLYCEMVLNLLVDLGGALDDYLDAKYVKHVIETMDFTISEFGYTRKSIDDEIKIIEKNAVAFQVADENPEIEDIIVGYNHYLLRGNIDEKRKILKSIADALEPKRNELESISKKYTSDFFYLVNNMNIRHNNKTFDDKHYNEKYAKMNENQIENVYDMAYEQALLLFQLLSQPIRDAKIMELKAEI